MIDNYLLYYLIVFSEVGSLLKASEILNLSQPSLSKAMQKLEDELEIPIFTRTGNKISLNDNGLKILSYAKEILEINKRLKKTAADIKNGSCKLAIGYTAPGIMYKYPHVFMNSENKLIISATLDNEENLLDGLVKNEYAAIFINKSVKIDGYICQHIMTEKLYLSIPKTHFLAGLKDGVSWKDIDGQSFLLFSYIGFWKKILSENLFKSRYIENTNMDDLNELNKYSSIPSFATNMSLTFFQYNNRIQIPILDANAALDFYLVYKKGNQTIKDLFK